jgi:hypothetical protein
MTNIQALDSQIATWRRTLADHEATLRDAGALAVAGDAAQAAQAFQSASIGVQVAQAAIVQLEGQRAAAAARDDLDRAAELDSEAAALEDLAAPISAQVAALIDQAARLGVTLVRRGTQHDTEMQSQARAYRSEAAMLRVRSGKVL